MEAYSDDDEFAALRAVDDAPEHAERLSDWTREFEMLVNIYERLGSLYGATLAVNGQKPPKIEPHRRPVTAAERARIQSRRDRHERLVNRLVGGD